MRPSEPVRALVGGVKWIDDAVIESSCQGNVPLPSATRTAAVEAEAEKEKAVVMLAIDSCGTWSPSRQTDTLSYGLLLLPSFVSSAFCSVLQERCVRELIAPCAHRDSSELSDSCTVGVMSECSLLVCVPAVSAIDAACRTNRGLLVAAMLCMIVVVLTRRTSAGGNDRVGVVAAGATAGRVRGAGDVDVAGVTSPAHVSAVCSNVPHSEFADSVKDDNDGGAAQLTGRKSGKDASCNVDTTPACCIGDGGTISCNTVRRLSPLACCSAAIPVGDVLACM